MHKTTDSVNPVWVFAEQAGGQLTVLSLELTGAAAKLAKKLQVPLEVILLGDKLSGQDQTLIAAGADMVFIGEGTELRYYQPELYQEIILKLLEERQPQIFLIGSTALGRELAPMLAAKLHTGLCSHSIGLELDDQDRLVQLIPAYGGIACIACPEKRPQMVTIGKGVFPKPELEEFGKGKTKYLDIPLQSNNRIRTLEIVYEKDEGSPLETARVVVAGGAGAGDSEGWKLISDLAEALGGTLGATRPPVDEGWIEEALMIGQSGKTVSPELYIGVGLSGELQHTVGIKGAKVMVGINSNPKAPIFEQVDLGIVDNLHEFVPSLLEAVKNFKKESQ